MTTKLTVPPDVAGVGEAVGWPGVAVAAAVGAVVAVAVAVEAAAAAARPGAGRASSPALTTMQ
ncbi:MAG TPA: hypothetical protein VNL71_03410, partial [Chloroflexota bacterium]|nr:hypothetical protein [Chloroflexota bacterium]